MLLNDLVKELVNYILVYTFIDFIRLLADIFINAHGYVYFYFGFNEPCICKRFFTTVKLTARRPHAATFIYDIVTTVSTWNCK